LVEHFVGSYRDLNVDDVLAGQPGHSCRSDMLDANRHQTKLSPEVGGDYPEGVGSSRIRLHYLHRHRNAIKGGLLLQPGPSPADLIVQAYDTYRRLDAAGVVRRSVAPAVSRQQLSDALERGMSAPAIAAALRVSVTCVCRGHAREQLMTPTQAARQRRRLRQPSTTADPMAGEADQPWVGPVRVWSVYLLAAKASRIGPGMRPRSLTV
jgi:hypothetical protein